MCIRDRLNSQCSSDYDTSAATGYTSCYEKYSERSIITPNTYVGAFAAGDDITFTHSSSTTVKTLEDLISGSNGTAAFTYVQFDLRGMYNGSDNLSFKGNFTFGDSSMGTGAIGDQLIYHTTAFTEATSANANVGIAYFEGLVGNTILNAPTHKAYGFGSLTASEALKMKIHFSAVDASTYLEHGVHAPLSIDVVTWGQSNDGVNSSDRHNNAIYRMEAEESGNNNSSMFAGEVEYIMLNQLNVN